MYERALRFYPPAEFRASIELLNSSGDVAQIAQPSLFPAISFIRSNISSLCASVVYLLSMKPKT
jgi:hypothetical protein